MPVSRALSVAVGRRLRELRLEAGVPLDRLAAQTGLRPRKLVGIEEGTEKPTIATLDRIARGLQVPLVELVTSARTKRPKAATPQREVQPASGAPRSLEAIARAITSLPASVGDKLEAVDLAVVEHALAVCGGNRSAAARLLGIERKAVIRRWVKMKRSRKS
jgi:transcriptional regulator with XRE-family HTH domain